MINGKGQEMSKIDISDLDKATIRKLEDEPCLIMNGDHNLGTFIPTKRTKEKSDLKAHWNYRIFKKPFMPEDPTYTLREIYYSEDGQIDGFTNPLEFGESSEDLIGHLALQLLDATK